MEVHFDISVDRWLHSHFGGDITEQFIDLYERQVRDACWERDDMTTWEVRFNEAAGVVAAESEDGDVLIFDDEASVERRDLAPGSEPVCYRCGGAGYIPDAGVCVECDGHGYLVR